MLAKSCIKAKATILVKANAPDEGMMNKLILMLGGTLVLALFTLAGCSGGGTPASNSTATSSNGTTSNNVISGIASDGPLSGSTSYSFAITTGGAQGTHIGSCTPPIPPETTASTSALITAQNCFKRRVELTLMKSPARPFLSPHP